MLYAHHGRQLNRVLRVDFELSFKLIKGFIDIPKFYFVRNCDFAVLQFLLVQTKTPLILPPISPFYAPIDLQKEVEYLTSRLIIFL